MTTPLDRLRYLGPNHYVPYLVTNTRDPNGNDIYQDNGAFYVCGDQGLTFWYNTADRELWFLSAFENIGGEAVALWVALTASAALAPISKIITESGSIVPNINGEITLTGVTTTTATGTDKLLTKTPGGGAENIGNIGINPGISTGVSALASAGAASFFSTHFVVDLNGFVSSQVSTTTQIGIVTLATQAQSQRGTYGTNQVLQVGQITNMLATPAPIGSVSPSTGDFTHLTSNNGQIFTAPAGTFPVTDVTALSTGYTTPNTTIRTRMDGVVPASISAGFGNALELFLQTSTGPEFNAGGFYASWDTPTAAAATSSIHFRLMDNASNIDPVIFYPHRIELRLASDRFRFGTSGADMASGTGDPNGTVTAAKGSLYLRLDGSSASTRAYINTNGATAWTNLVTAA